ncbi:MAG: hypothetical protein ACTHMI_14075 [Mucilaginibacter sp.]
MLQHLTWSAYLTAIVITAAIYYVLIGLTYYRHELGNAFNRFSGKQPRQLHPSGGDLILPSADVVGGTRTDGMDIVDQEELVFASPDEDRQVTDLIQLIRPTAADAHLLGDLSEMVAETKTLIRVIKESNESKENFEMLFRLVVQKYPDLAGTVYEDQINAYLLKAAADLFPFTLTNSELQTYWLNEEKLQSA